MVKFHEDTIFKDVSCQYGHLILKLIHVPGKIVKVLPTEFAIVDPKMYKPDLVLELETKIYIIEFQSSVVDIRDEKRFRFYSALVDFKKNEKNKEIEVHVLSSVENEKINIYKVNEYSQFPIFIHSLKEMDFNKFINNINSKIINNKSFDDEELVELSLAPFMHSEERIDKRIIKTAKIINMIDNVNEDLDQFIRGIELLLADKFIKDKKLRTHAINILGGNMRIVEEYAEEYAKEYAKEYANDKIEENNAQIIKNMFKMASIQKQFPKQQD